MDGEAVEEFIENVKGDVTDPALCDAVASAARVLFESEEENTTTLPVDMTNVDGDKAREIATAVIDLGQKQDEATQAAEKATAVANSVHTDENGQNSQG